MKKILFGLVTLTLAMSISAFAKDDAAKKAEGKMVAACKKEYSKEVKGKSSKEIADWVETEERGANAETFKKSKCYNLHEDWEKAAGSNEAGETEHQ